MRRPPIGKTKFHEISGNYSTSFLRSYLEDLTKPGGSFEKVAGAIQDVKLKLDSISYFQPFRKLKMK